MMDFSNRGDWRAELLPAFRAHSQVSRGRRLMSSLHHMNIALHIVAGSFADLMGHGTSQG